ncbi:conserved hypothetical protein [Planktothrix serta PCC 8927]|uniref:DUF1802 domain-containing protein n=1 Tax=Planktothrix serta PCC 8927 TaxID=671068 RepID=A0A7Z9BRZ0_9CYAN|nr:DUF1802 family protein [Planktothrix serta]VXD19733.1 conserved hypothetical protein [Planktothrix serta PCC 8927]
MNQLSIATAFCLPAPDIEALNQGRNILVMPRIFMGQGRLFALYPTDIEFNSLPLEQYYRPGFIPTAKQSIAELNQDKVKIKVWAKCEDCQTLDKPEELETLSKLTVWTAAALHKTLEQRGHIFLAYFRVYRLPQPLEIDPVSNSQFISLPYAITVDENQAILDSNQFETLYRKILNRQPPEHPELEELENAIAQLTLTDPDAQFFKDQIQTFLGWKPEQRCKISENLNWIYTINQLGTTAEGGNYEKGTAFEKIVHQSLNFLGFELDQNAKGGAGGMDLYCTKPYPMVGECKAGQSIPAGATQELIRLGGTHLGQQLFNQAVKLIIGPGKPTPQVQKSAQEFKISIINPMTLEKLVKLQAQYPGSVNLFELKDYLQAGQMDDKINEYIEMVVNRLKLRSHIIQLFKQLNQPINLDNLIGAYSFSNPPQPLEREQLKEILIELSSPLTGYLGRTPDERFYFLRELIVDQSQSFD